MDVILKLHMALARPQLIMRLRGIGVSKPILLLLYEITLGVAPSGPRPLVEMPHTCRRASFHGRIMTRSDLGSLQLQIWQKTILPSLVVLISGHFLF